MKMPDRTWHGVGDMSTVAPPLLQTRRPRSHGTVRTLTQGKEEHRIRSVLDFGTVVTTLLSARLLAAPSTPVAWKRLGLEEEASSEWRKGGGKTPLRLP